MRRPGKCLPLALQEQGSSGPAFAPPPCRAANSPGLFLLSAAFNMKASHRMLSNTKRGCRWRTCPLQQAVFLPHPFSPRPHAEPTAHDKELWRGSSTIKTHYSIFMFIPQLIWEFKCWICVPLVPTLTVSLTTRTHVYVFLSTHAPAWACACTRVRRHTANARLAPRPRAL